MKKSLLILILCVFIAHAQYSVSNSVFGNGGQTVTDSSNFSIRGTTGQTLIGESTDDNFVGLIGFWHTSFGITSDIEISFDNLPKAFSLYQNYPNPFNPSTKIKFDVPVSTDVKIVLYNILGEKVRTLVNKKYAPGRYEYVLNASGLAAGLYFYRIKTDKYTNIKRMILIK